MSENDVNPHVSKLPQSMSLIMWLKSKNPQFKAPIMPFLPDPNKEVNHEFAVMCEKANTGVCKP